MKHALTLTAFLFALPLAFGQDFGARQVITLRAKRGLMSKISPSSTISAISTAEGPHEVSSSTRGEDEGEAVVEHGEPQGRPL